MKIKFVKVCFVFILIIVISSGKDFRGNHLRKKWYSKNFISKIFQGSKTSSIVDQTLKDLDFIKKIDTLMQNPRWRRVWRKFPSLVRDRFIFQLVTLSRKQNSSSLHCNNAYSLCQEDSNCRVKFWNFLNSCSPTVHNLTFRDFISGSEGDEGLYFPVKQPRRTARSVYVHRRRKYLRKHRLLKKRVFKKRRRKQFFKQKRRYRTFRRHLKRLKKRWKKTIDKLHYWMGRYYLNVYEKRNLNQNFQQCSTKCLNALVLFNNTVYGPLLANCDCGEEKLYSNNSSAGKNFWSPVTCVKHQNIALSCRPRLHKPVNAGIGCTRWRAKCESNPRCNRAQNIFLRHCSQAFSGVKCTKSCFRAFKKLKLIQNNFHSCVCDGVNKHFCLKIKANLKKLCFSNQDENNNKNSTIRRATTYDDTKMVLRTKKSIFESYNNANDNQRNSFVFSL